MSEISSQSAAAKPKAGATAWAGLTPLTGALLALVLVAGLGGTYVVSRDIRTEAAEVWDDRADTETDRLTATLLQWIETSVTPVHAMATLFQGSIDVSRDEFWDAVTLVEDNQQDFFPSSMVVLSQAKIAGRDTWQVVHSMTEEGQLAVGSDVSEDVTLAPAVAAALENPGQGVIGSLYRDELGTAWLVPGIAVEAPYDRYVIMGLVDLNQMIDGLNKTQVPEGLVLRLSGSAASARAEASVLLSGAGEATDGTVVTNAIRGVVGGARFNFLWDVTGDFQGGTVSRRADLVLFGGIVATALLALFILFLLRQNDQIARVVRERTAELRLALDNMPGGMFMVDKDLTVRVHNDRFSEIYGLPQGTIRSGGSLRDTVRVRAERGDYGPGDVDALVVQRIESYGRGQSERVEERLPNGRIVELVRAPTGDGGTVAVVTDITERVKSEETAKRLREAIEGFTDSIILYDKDERVVFSNDRYHELYPNAPPKDEIVGCTQEQLLRRSLEAGLIEDPLAKSDPESWLAQRLEERRQNRFQSGETVHGSGRTLMIRHRPTSEGGLIVAHTDITERKEAEKRLAEKETQLRLAMDYMPGAIFVVDEELRLVLVNDHYGELYGHPDGMVVAGTSMEDVLRHELKQGILIGEGPPEDILQKRLDSFRSREASTFEDVTPAGRYLQISRQPAPDNKVVTVITDITRQKKAEEQIETQRAQFHDILENVPQGIALFDRNKKLLAWNSKYPKTLNVDPSMVSTDTTINELTLHLAKLGYYGEGDIEAKADARVRKLYSGNTRAELSFDGKSIFDAQGTLTPDGRVVVIYTDITERKAAEERILANERQLRDILEDSPIAVAISVDDQSEDDGLIEFANRRFTDMIGFGSEDIGHIRTEQFLPKGEDRAEHEKKLDEGVSLVNMDIQIKRRDGSDLWALMSLSPIQFNDRKSALIWIYDITERKKAEVEIQETKERLAGAYDLITSSIQYASRIQRALLPSDGVLRDLCPEHFCIWEPRDVVGGDMYWVGEDRHGYVVCLFDCTGHGVPGALMTTIAVSALNVAFAETGDPARLIARVNKAIKQALGQHEEEGPSDDGLEMGICLVEPERRRVTFAGARFELLSAVGDSIDVIKGDKHGVGYRRVPFESRFTNHSIRLKPGQRLYMYSDGIIDQIGGNRRRAFGRKRLTTLLRGLAHMPLPKQGAAITSALADYQGGEARRDDVSMIGFMPTP